MWATIKFDNECINWVENGIFNKAFIWQQISYIRDRIRLKGYIYLNEIYDIFGAKWDPHDSNYCLIYGENCNDFICSVIQLNDTDYTISICY